MKSPARPELEMAAAAFKGAQAISMSDPSFVMLMSNESRGGLNGAQQVNINELFKTNQQQHIMNESDGCGGIGI
jgi:hypothetical protein